MAIAAPADLLKRLGIRSDVGTLAVAGSAIDAATEYLAGVLGTRLDSCVEESIFQIGSIHRPISKVNYGSALYQLRTQNMFVSTLQLSAGEDIEAIDSWESATPISFDSESGIFRISASIGLYIKAVAAIDLSTIPAWLKEACITQAAIIMTSQKPSDDHSPLGVTVKQAQQHLNAILDRHIRGNVYAVLPLYSSSV